MTSVRRGAIGAVTVTALLGLGLLNTATAEAATIDLPTGAKVVGHSSSSTCPHPGYSNIQDAVSAASAGNVIYVCAGTYNGHVSVNKRLSFLGAKFGNDARIGRTDLSKETVVTAPSGAFKIESGVDKVYIDGFTLRGSGSDNQNGDGIDAFSGGSGHIFVNNVFEDNTNGMNINSNGSSQTRVQRNRFTANNRSGGQGGTGVVLTSGPANNLLVSDNSFQGHDSAAFNSIGDDSHRSTGIVFRNNKSVDDSSLAVINNAVGAKVQDNTSDKAQALGGTAIYIVGNTDGLVVSGNKITGGTGTGISANAAFGAGPSINLTIENNVIRERTTGIRVTGAHHSVTIRKNQIFNSHYTDTTSGYGIRLAPETSGVTVTNNVALGSSNRDCRDESHGSSTSGTANTWTTNAGLTSDPIALCLPGLNVPGLPHL